MSISITIRLTTPTPSLNELNKMNASRELQKKLSSLKVDWGNEISGCLWEYPSKWKKLKGKGYFRKVRIIRSGKKLLDPTDNLPAGAKYHIDALKTEGCIEDDAPGMCDIQVEQISPATPKDIYTLIILSEWEGIE